MEELMKGFSGDHGSDDELEDEEDEKKRIRKIYAKQ